MSYFAACLVSQLNVFSANVRTNNTLAHKVAEHVTLADLIDNQHLSQGVLITYAR